MMKNNGILNLGLSCIFFVPIERFKESWMQLSKSRNGMIDDSPQSLAKKNINQDYRL
ncbi:hypothetical protein [Brasilonema bromeliae]|uniref:hypothetical protein n=1 Tax=Brasilonema bromeliae TaxID=383615 RepID=UPI00145F5320|nr:hypothetical protein [Brasilonema bromeliae]